MDQALWDHCRQQWCLSVTQAPLPLHGLWSLPRGVGVDFRPLMLAHPMSKLPSLTWWSYADLGAQDV